MTNGGRVEPVHNEFGGDPRFTDPALRAGRAFAEQLGVPTSAVREGKAPAASPTRRAGRPALPAPSWVSCSRRRSCTSSTGCCEQSDNVLAEALARQVALAGGKEASFAGASAAIERQADRARPARGRGQAVRRQRPLAEQPDQPAGCSPTC